MAEENTRLEDGRITVGARVSTETYEKLQWLAQQSRRSMSDVIRILIENATLMDLAPEALRRQMDSNPTDTAADSAAAS